MTKETYRFACFAAAICANAITLSGCAGSQPPASAAVSVIPARTSHNSRSWMDSDSSRHDLLYISSQDRGDVYVYTYPRGRLVGTLTDFIQPVGECTDSTGDVFVVASANPSGSSSTIYEFAHGGANPIGTLSDPDPGIGCSVDPISGNLAVCGNGVAIYEHATGKPTMYHSSQYVVLRSCGYDNQGNLYLSTGSDEYANQAQLVRLARGSGAFEPISIDVKLYTGNQYPSVQWDGRHLAVTSNPWREPISVYRLRISGKTASVVGSPTNLDTAKNDYHGQLWIQARTVIGLGQYKRSFENAFFWPFPKGGDPSREIMKIGDVRQFPFGVTVSVAQPTNAHLNV